MIYIGIDPGLFGAVAILDTPPGTPLDVRDTPTVTLQMSRGTRREYDVSGMAAILAPFMRLHVHVILEESQAMPGQGVRSTFTTGLGFGLWLGVLAALTLPYTRVRPAIWKRALSLGKDKERARLRAMQLFPTADLRRKKDHGRAEALLLAWYGLHVTPIGYQ